MRYENFKRQIENKFLMLFPESEVHVYVTKFAERRSIWVRWYLQKEGYTSNIKENDKLFSTLGIDLMDDYQDGTFKMTHKVETGDFELPEKMKLFNSNARMALKPTNPYHAMKTHHMPFRKRTSTPENMLKGILKLLSEYKNEFTRQVHSGNLYGQEKIDAKYLQLSDKALKNAGIDLLGS